LIFDPTAEFNKTMIEGFRASSINLAYIVP
jgi:hypothetical protein